MGTNIKPNDFKRKGSASEGYYYGVWFNTETGEFGSKIEKNWLHDDNAKFDEYDKSSAGELIESYNDYLSDEEGDYKYYKKELVNNIKKFGSKKVIQSLVKHSVGVKTSEGEIDNVDAAKCEISSMLMDWKVKVDDETKKLLKYNPDNVWWL